MAKKNKKAEAAPEVEAAAPVEAAQAEKPKAKKGRSKKGAETAPLPLEEVEAATPLDPAEAAVAAEVAEMQEAQARGEAAHPDEPEAETNGTAKPVDFAALSRTVEALLFACEEPLQVREIARAAGSDSATIRKVIPLLKETYAKENRAWDVAEVAGGWRLVTRPEFYPAIQRLKTQTAQRKLTQAALETLALIAYRQPIGRAEIESVRGVGAGPVLRQLLEKKLIKIAGRGTGLGQPLLYGTTDYFLEHFGLKNTTDLPKPGEFKNT